MKNNIIIAGVPRAGKSTVSHILSQEYGYQHVSMDSIIAGFFLDGRIKRWIPAGEESVLYVSL